LNTISENILKPNNRPKSPSLRVERGAYEPLPEEIKMSSLKNAIKRHLRKENRYVQNGKVKVI